MLVTIRPNDSLPLTDQIVRGIQRLVEQRHLRHGSRLPSIRQFALDHGISRFTVVQAYDRLVATGHVISRQGAGFFVDKPATDKVRRSQASVQLDKADDVLWLIRQQSKENRLAHLPGCGWLPPSWLDCAGLEKALRAVARMGGEHLMGGYGSALGCPLLRESIARHMGDIGVEADSEQVLMTHGIVGAIDLVCRYLVKPGDVILVDDPGYYQTFGHMQALGATVIGVPWTATGPDVQAFEALCAEHKPRLYITTSVVHNPTGCTISHATAHRVLRSAEAHDFLIIEDDVYGVFKTGSPPRLATLDQLERVIYVNGFSKTLSPRLRVGFLVASHKILADLLDLKLLTHLVTSELAERVIYQVMRQGQFRKYLSQLQIRLAGTRSRVARELENIGFVSFADTANGMFLWMRHPDVDNTSALAGEAANHDLLLAPGTMFSPSRTPSPWLRFNIAHTDKPAIDILSRLIEKS